SQPISRDARRGVQSASHATSLRSGGTQSSFARVQLGATSKPYHHAIPPNVEADVGSTSRNLSLYGRIFAPTVASWPIVMSMRRSTYCRPRRGLRGVLHEYETRSCGASAPAECHHVLFCYRPTSNPGRRAR